MYCPDCGTYNGDKSFYCMSCGARLTQEQEDQKTFVVTSYPTPAQHSDGPSTQPSTVLDFADEPSADGRENIQWYLYLIAVLFWPLGIYFWAIYRDKNPDDARNLFIVSIAGFFLLVFLFTN